MKTSLEYLFSKDIVLPRYKFFESVIGANMHQGKAETVLRYKIWQLEKLELVKLELHQAIKILMGCEPTDEVKSGRSIYEYVYNHHKDKTEISKWSSYSKVYELKKRKWLFKKKLEWSVKHCKLNELEQSPPSEMMLRVLESRRAKLFNVYSVLVSSQKIMLLGQVWELPPVFCGPKVKYSRTGEVAYFYLGDWRLS